MQVLLERYLGGADSELARGLLDAARREVRILVHFRTLDSWDYTDRKTETVDRPQGLGRAG